MGGTPVLEAWILCCIIWARGYSTGNLDQNHVQSRDLKKVYTYLIEKVRAPLSSFRLAASTIEGFLTTCTVSLHGKFVK